MIAQKLMKIVKITMILGFLSLVLSNLSARDITEVDIDFVTFWPKFKAAVRKNDRAQVVSMTNFPFGYLAYGDKTLSEKEFVEKYDEIFNRAIRQCFSKKSPFPVENDFLENGIRYTGYSFFCNGSIFTFGKVKDQYKFFEKYPDD